eukprot:SAG31_NODE_55_length_29938_cov_9.154027_12_plen_116_part_00
MHPCECVAPLEVQDALQPRGTGHCEQVRLVHARASHRKPTEVALQRSVRTWALRGTPRVAAVHEQRLAQPVRAPRHKQCLALSLSCIDRPLQRSSVVGVSVTDGTEILGVQTPWW